ncbi:unnamed protein product [Arabidopsis lyrata]|uniref:uncharacterized protein LOC110225480 isoform X2 n=1 Tax=Arabidopsis lyrata subsp. lyrata TaxID=81972 RepID=UPI000A29C0CB|nr:uncharacterized protein LOC110225480 isoform X2 [Arabidopsis lyrata subsp. lyrata]CAH8255210.1 unnamed protein product [Arabidopsis lyrata]|eukprot:XP_020870980.1 uncharacterized protein LOC110225480 isoform X2 [Arabidopsis lyrata subsp. lyrata]
MPRKSAVGGTCVFWDVECCPIPGGVDPDSICKKIKSAVAKKGNCGGKVSIRAYNKTIQESDSLCYAGVRLVNEESGSIVDKMQKDILFWALENRPKPNAKNHDRPNLVVIAESVSQESDFGRTLLYLKLRNYNVIAALPKEDNVACPYASSACLWTSLFDSGKPIYQSGSAH